MKTYNKTLLIIGGIGVGVVVLVIGAYIMKFHGYVLGDQTQWGVFGDYVGGTTNSLLGLLTFIGVLFTISLTYAEAETQKSQHEENKEIQNNQRLEMEAAQKKQQKKEDIYRIIETIYNEIKNVLSTEVSTGVFIGQNSSAPVSRVIDIKWRDEESRAAIIKKNEDLFGLIHDLLFQLKYYLTKYDDLAEDDLTSSYYKRFLLVPVLNLWAAGRIGEELKDWYEKFTVHS